MRRADVDQPLLSASTSLRPRGELTVTVRQRRSPPLVCGHTAVPGSKETRRSDRSGQAFEDHSRLDAVAASKAGTP